MSGYRLFESGKLQPVIYNKIYTLENVTDGLIALESRGTWGKAIARVREEGNMTAKL